MDPEAPNQPATPSPRARLQARGRILIARVILVLDLVLDRIRSFHRVHRSTP